LYIIASSLFNERFIISFTTETAEVVDQSLSNTLTPSKLDKLIMLIQIKCMWNLKQMQGMLDWNKQHINFFVLLALKNDLQSAVF
jgi:hypothetical protein